MTFGLCNAGHIFQRFIDEVLHRLNFVYLYTDDILVASETEEEHTEHLRILFNRLQEYRILTNPSDKLNCWAIIY